MNTEKVGLFYKNVPCLRAHHMSVGVLPKESPVLIVKISTDKGFAGYGDLTSFEPYVSEDHMTAAHMIKRCLAPTLIGMNPFDIETAHRRMDMAVYANHYAKTAIDVALYDIMGKALAVAESANMPAHQSEFWQTGIGKAADAHFGVSGPNFMEESGFELCTIRERAIADNPLRFEDGYIYPPEGPGLGVEVEDERLYREWSQF